jgi:hypothetical protein
MAAIDFPNSPTVGQEFTVGDRTWTWTGSTWDAVPGTINVADITDLTATATEINYTDGVTSAIQTQINGKLSATITDPSTGQTLQYNGTAWVNAAPAAGGETISSFLLMGA